MRVCGIEISGSQARIVILEGTKASYKHVSVDPKKVDLEDDDSSANVRSFRDVFQALVRDQQIDHLGIKKRNKKGEFSGGPMSFKIEGILQLLDECDVHLLSPVTIASVVKKVAPQTPDKLVKYQHTAFEIALTLLQRVSDG